MGQQQLLLLVLGIVIVGLAVVVGIQAFGENQKKSNADALVNDVVRIASDAQAWNLKPAAFGGGAGAFSGLSFEQLGYVSALGVYTNLNGKFQLSGIAAGTVTITACDEQVNFDNLIVADVSGTAPTDIRTAVSTASCPF
jgi:hypothetical protein